jgi:hypothetical protein
MSSDQEAEALQQHLEALVKDVETFEARVVAACCHVHAARHLRDEEQLLPLILIEEGCHRQGDAVIYSDSLDSS